MSMFKDGFKEPEVNFPDKIVHEEIKDFENATQGLASLSILELDDIERISASGIDNTFLYRILLTSQYLKGYSFKVIEFGYDVSLYPVNLILQSEIGDELGIKASILRPPKIVCPDEENLVKAINAVFSTDKFRTTVGGLMKIARAKSDAT